MREGVLIFDHKTKSIDIRFGLLDYYGGLQRGDSLEILVDDQWLPTELKKNGFWYLKGIQTRDLNGLIVRIDIERNK